MKPKIEAGVLTAIFLGTLVGIIFLSLLLPPMIMILGV